jgi:hypothetical protein
VKEDLIKQRYNSPGVFWSIAVGTKVCLPSVCVRMPAADGDAADVRHMQPDGCDLERIRGNELV